MGSHRSLVMCMCLSILMASAWQAQAINFGSLAGAWAQLSSQLQSRNAVYCVAGITAIAGIAKYYSTTYCTIKKTDPQAGFFSPLAKLARWAWGSAAAVRSKREQKPAATAAPAVGCPPAKDVTATNLQRCDYEWSLHPGTTELVERGAPVVRSIKWGLIVLAENSVAGAHKDCVVVPEGFNEWDWKQDGTRHNPGVTVVAVQRFIDNVDVVILTRGMQGALQVPQETIDFVKSKGKTCHVGQTIAMVQKYNEEVAQGRRVGALIHTTC